MVRVPCTNLAAFRSWVLGLLDHAEVLEPPAVRADLVAWLSSIAADRADERSDEQSATSWSGPGR